MVLIQYILLGIRKFKNYFFIVFQQIYLCIVVLTKVSYPLTRFMK